MSSLLSRRGGTARRSVFRRYQRSWRKRPSATRRARSTFVALTTRTSAVRVAVSPIRWYSRSWRKRRSRACAVGDSSATSSTNRVPPSAFAT